MSKLEWKFDDASKGSNDIAEFFQIDGVKLSDLSRKELEDLIIIIYYANLKTGEVNIN